MPQKNNDAVKSMISMWNDSAKKCLAMQEMMMSFGGMFPGMYPKKAQDLDVPIRMMNMWNDWMTMARDAGKMMESCFETNDRVEYDFGGFKIFVGKKGYEIEFTEENEMWMKMFNPHLWND